MTSQKRYRHHENNTAHRFRDIPPRFKRQKSSSSPKPSEDIDNQENQCVSQTSPATDPSQTCSGATMTPVPSNKEENHTDQGDGVWQHENRTGPASVLSEVENQYHPVQNWNAVNNGQFSSAGGFMSPPLYTWQSQHNPQCNPAVHPQTLYSYQPLMVRSDTISPSLKMAQVKADQSVTGYVANGPRTLSPPSCLSSPGMPSGAMDGRTSSTPDYSDPDIRTIEMLRELERVADEKEKEDENDPTVDRKNLVSHHLRMLMCAVDKYTEGVDDSALSPNELQAQSPPSTKEVVDESKSSGWKQSAKGQSASSSGAYSDALKQHTNQNMTNVQDNSPWQTVPSNSRRQTPKSKTPQMPQRYSPQTPPPASSPARTPPPAVNNAVGSPVTPHHSRTPSPYIPHQTSATGYPMRAITKYNNDQIQSHQMAGPPPLHRSGMPQSQMTMPCSLSPAPSPPRSVWGPVSMDSPSDSKSWDLWSGPSFVADIYRGQPSGQQPLSGNNMAMYGFVPYAPVDMKEHMPLYRR